jgi:hypothetical protein
MTSTSPLSTPSTPHSGTLGEVLNRPPSTSCSLLILGAAFFIAGLYASQSSFLSLCGTDAAHGAFRISGLFAMTGCLAQRLDADLWPFNIAPIKKAVTEILYPALKLIGHIVLSVLGLVSLVYCVLAFRG